MDQNRSTRRSQTSAEAAFSLFNLRFASLSIFQIVAEPPRGAFTIASTSMVKFLQKILDYHQNLIIASLVHMPSLHRIFLVEVTTVMWSETVRPSVLRQDRSETKKSVLVLQVWCCVVKHGLATLVVVMILKDAANFQVPFMVSLFCAWNITTVEINSGVHLLKS